MKVKRFFCLLLGGIIICFITGIIGTKEAEGRYRSIVRKGVTTAIELYDEQKQFWEPYDKFKKYYFI